MIVAKLLTRITHIFEIKKEAFKTNNKNKIERGKDFSQQKQATLKENMKKRRTQVGCPFLSKNKLLSAFATVHKYLTTT